jgi:endonuclease/exonuclease/phosphatase family metal-dependent hydrolase
MYRAVKKGAGMLYRTRVSKAGLAIVARRDLMEDHQFHEFKYTTLSKWDFLSSKGFQTFTAMVAEDTEVMFINTHLDSGKDRDSLAARLTQIAHIVEVASEFEGPIVLVGDLNLNVNREGDSYLLGKLMDDLDLTIAVKDRFDYILVSRGIYVLGTEVILKEVNPSDHAALLVTLEFN